MRKCGFYDDKINVGVLRPFNIISGTWDVYQDKLTLYG